MANESLSKLRKLQAGAQALLDVKEDDAQEAEQLAQSPEWIRFCVRVHRSFVKNRGLVRAAALAYTTVLSLVPLLAIAVSVSTGLLKREGEEPIQQLLDGFVRYVAPALDLKAAGDPGAGRADSEGEINRKRVVNEINGFIQRFKSTTLGASGVLALIFVAISLLGTVEATFNDMWGVREGRSWPRRVALYWTGLTLGPLLFVAAVGITGASQFKTAESWIGQIEFLRNALYLFLLPCLVLGLSLSLLYMLMPNAKVDWRAALAGGFAGALLLQGNSAFSVMYLSRVVTYRDIYGTLAAVPLFLLGLYVSWVIVLLGGQVAYVFQTRKTQDADRRAEKINQRSREFAALRVMACVGQRFQTAASAPSGADIARALEIPETLAAQILEILVQNKLLVQAAGAPTGYSPARPLEKITAQDILHAMRAGAGCDLARSEGASSRLIQEQFDAISRAEAQAAGAVTLRELVARTATDSTAQSTPKTSL
ncbi:MAG: YihY family inner membrane protein [Verrucomicrobia bacterium]|nr:YihY family inner membrane protein [Verrucomicrobiota bacterium]